MRKKESQQNRVFYFGQILALGGHLTPLFLGLGRVDALVAWERQTELVQLDVRVFIKKYGLDGVEKVQDKCSPSQISLGSRKSTGHDEPLPAFFHRPLGPLHLPGFLEGTVRAEKT